MHAGSTLPILTMASSMGWWNLGLMYDKLSFPSKY